MVLRMLMMLSLTMTIAAGACGGGTDDNDNPSVDAGDGAQKDVALCSDYASRLCDKACRCESSPCAVTENTVTVYWDDEIDCNDGETTACEDAGGTTERCLEDVADAQCGDSLFEVGLLLPESCSVD